tara:strand:+ start:37 stop:204 length:168 start_codon:yes stop_codon:yes gene_type:complete
MNSKFDLMGGKKAMEALPLVITLVILIILLIAAGILFATLNTEGGGLLDGVLNLF